jgi:formiminoglutamate deiminase
VTRRLWLERAWLGDPAPSVAEAPPLGQAAPLGQSPPPGDTADGVVVSVDGGRITGVLTGVATPPPGAERLMGLTIPGMANCHSHAFHRALRGRTQRGRTQRGATQPGREQGGRTQPGRIQGGPVPRGQGSFWTWREQMYALAGRLDPDRYFDLARAVYREMLATGFTAVGEFHYLHHGPDGTPYADPNAMGQALVAAAREAGIRIALLDTCYLAAGVGEDVDSVQLRFSDGDADRWGERVDLLADRLTGADVVVGAAVHSVRAVPRDQLPQVAAWAQRREVPLHVHVSEQPAENDACLAAYGVTPTRLLAEAGALGRRTTAVHATHLTAADVADLTGTATHVCLCPTTERDLGDGVGPARELADAGAGLTVGTDSHAVVDAFEEMRAVELDERLRTRRRGHFDAAELLVAATRPGHASLGFEDAGRIVVGARADLVTVDLASPRTAGAGGGVEAAVFAAVAEDVTQVVSGGRVVATAQSRAETGHELDAVLARIWRDA